MASGKIVYGDGTDALVLTGTIVSTTPVVGDIVDTRNTDGCSLSLAVDYQVDAITITGTDHVVASTGVWTFANYTFTAKVGAKLNVSGATHAGNNGTFTITAVTAHTATTATTGLVDETFTTAVTATVTRSEAASHPAGTWTVAGSNNFAPPSNSSSYGQAPGAGKFADISALFNSPAAIAAVTDAGVQYVQARYDGRSLQVTFTPSSGLGTPRCWIYTKSWST